MEYSKYTHLTITTSKYIYNYIFCLLLVPSPEPTKEKLTEC